MRIAAKSGHTLAEVLAATAIIGMVFVIVGSLYATSVRLLNSEVASVDVNSLLALETISRNINIAEDATGPIAAVLLPPSAAVPSSQIQLRIDLNDPSTADPANDQWVSYRFINDAQGVGRLRTKTGASAAAANILVTDTDATAPQVVRNLVINTAAGQSEFSLVSPTGVGVGNATVVDVRMVVIGNANEQNRTLSTRVALRRSK